MNAIIDAAHSPAPGAKDLAYDELAVAGPLFQYLVLLKASGQPAPRCAAPCMAGCCLLH